MCYIFKFTLQKFKGFYSIITCKITSETIVS